VTGEGAEPTAGDGWADGGTIARGRGRVAIRTREAPAVFLVAPAGVVGPGLLGEVVDRAAAFGTAHPGGWCYVADIRGAVLPDPRNGRGLRRIRRLPHVRAYLVVAPAFARPGLRLAARLGPLSRHGPQGAHATVADAVADATRRLA
jgi:hypothetical protein